MAGLIDLKEVEERVILIGVQTSEGDDTMNYLSELGELVKTAGAITADKIAQNQERTHPDTYLGRGKIERVKEWIWELDATGTVCGDELSLAQFHNLEQALDTKVVDGAMVILDIFASRANTSKDRIQVELTQLKYRAARLVGLRSSLSRPGSGIGTRGPGKKKLEMDHRLIHERTGQLEAESHDVERHRGITRQQRNENHATVVTIVSYTNTGKPTLLNSPTNAGTLTEDKLFVVLDPTARNPELPSGQQIPLTGTVGFIRELPHRLIETFKSTLEETGYSNITLHVMDCSNLQMDMQMYTVYETLKQLEVIGKIIVAIYSKIDKVEREERRLLKDLPTDYQLVTSTKTGEGIGELKDTLEMILCNQETYLEKIYPYGEANRIRAIRKYGELLSEKYREDGITMKAYMPAAIYGQLT